MLNPESSEAMHGNPDQYTESTAGVRWHESLPQVHLQRLMHHRVIKMLNPAGSNANLFSVDIATRIATRTKLAYITRWLRPRGFPGGGGNRDLHVRYGLRALQPQPCDGCVRAYCDLPAVPLHS
jgi:hypothetical protein